METLLYVLGFIIGALGTSFLLYLLKTRKTLRQQHELIELLTVIAFDKIIEHLNKKDSDMKDSEPARQEPGNTAGAAE